MPVNALNQPIGQPLHGWEPPGPLPDSALAGRWCRLERLDPARHGADLWQAVAADADGRNWTYLPYGPFEAEAGYHAWLEQIAPKPDPFFHAILDPESGKAVGIASLMRIDPAAGTIEVGHIHYAPALQRTPAATEAMYLLMGRAFGLGYRRYEWKCDALNGPSRRAAERLGFRFEGIFRQATHYKGRNRDTAWFSVIDGEWPRLKAAFEAWLAPENFAEDGRQRRGLAEIRATL